MVISTEHNLMTGSTQYEFIVNSLQNVDHDQTPWIIMAGHRYKVESISDNIMSHSCLL